MKKDKRLPYLVLTEVELPDDGMVSLCCFCHYAYWIGGCKETENDCKHPLWQVNETQFDNAIEGGDCWGFRPDMPIADAADKVGRWLQGKAG